MLRRRGEYRRPGWRDQLGGVELLGHAARPRLDLEDLTAARIQVDLVGQGGPGRVPGRRRAVHAPQP
jgi:hypothetical protein